MKEGDKIFFVTKDGKKRDSLMMLIIDRISKDGTKFRPRLMPDCSATSLESISFRDERLITDYETLNKSIVGIFSEYSEGMLVMNGTLPTCWSSFSFLKIKSIKEDDFDDVLNIECERYSREPMATIDSNFSFPAVRINDGDKVPSGFRVPLLYFGSAESLIRCLADYAGFTYKGTFLERFNKWQEKFGFDKTNELWTDFLGGTTQLEWAIDNDIDCMDYDRWQCLQKILKHELKYETVNEICNTLYNKEEIEILNCL